MRDVFGGFADVINKDNRLMSKATGATEMGLRIYDGSKVNKFLDNYEKEEMFCYVSSKRNKPSTIYYYDTDSWIMGSKDDLEKAFINSYNKKQLNLDL